MPSACPVESKNEQSSRERGKGKEGGREGGRGGEREREGGRGGEREGGREGGRDRGREGGREGGRERDMGHILNMSSGQWIQAPHACKNSTVHHDLANKLMDNHHTL